MSPVDDAPARLQVLASRAISGDARATESLLGAVHQMVRRYGRARLIRVPGGDQAAEDVAQEVCIATDGTGSENLQSGRGVIHRRHRWTLSGCYIDLVRVAAPNGHRVTVPNPT